MLYAFNKGEVCTCPSRALIQESIYDRFMDRCLKRIESISQGNPLDPATQVGPQVSESQCQTIESYVQIGRDEGVEVLIGGERPNFDSELDGGSFYEPTVLRGDNSMRVFQEEIFGPVLAVTTFKDEADALRIANDTIYGLGAGVWTRDGNRAFRMGRGIKAGRVWTNCYHLYPAGAAFGGYKMPPASDVSYRKRSSTTARPSACWSATTPRRSDCSNPSLGLCDAACGRRRPSRPASILLRRCPPPSAHLNPR